MKYIAHRINTISELKAIPKACGIEVDLRPWDDDIILEHDPFVKGELFEDLLKNFDHGTIVLNIKSERIEYRVKELLRKYKIDDYFFLDSSIPMINQLSNEGEKKIAVRFSELEVIDNLSIFKGRVDWVWVDCFTKFILTKEIEEKIHEMGFKICIVSPELQKREGELSKHKNIIDSNEIKIDAVCSKMRNYEEWMR